MINYDLFRSKPKAFVPKHILRIMRLTIIIMTTLLLQVSASTSAQKVTLNLKNASLVTVLQSVKEQTGYNFLYPSELRTKTKPISIQVKNMEIDQVLEACFANQPFVYSLEEKTIVVKEKEPSFLDNLVARFSAIDIRGKIIGENDQVLAGATVKVKGTNRVTKSNEKGEFYLAGVDEDAVLEISYIGFKALEIPIKGAVMPLEIKLNVLTGELEEVNVTVNTGYQTLPKERATGSFTVIDNKTLNQQVGTNILKRLEGVTNGLQFINKQDRNRRLGMAIRGFSSINGPLDPLVVLDGFIYEGNIENINPNDIENVTVLKDAAAASIWGARAGNGVIVLTTIKGKLNQKLQIKASVNVILSEKPDLYAVLQLPSSDYLAVEEFLFNKGYFNSAIATPYTPLTLGVEVFNRRKLKLISAGDSAKLIQELAATDSRRDYLKYFYTKVLTQQYTANIRGGSVSNAYTFAVGYDRVLGQTYERSDKLNIRLNNVYQPFKNLSINTGLYYTNTKGASGRLNSFQSIAVNSRTVPYLKFADENGNAIAVNSKYRGSYTDTAGAGKLLDWKYYPLNEHKYTDNSTVLQEYNVNMGLQYRFWKGFNFEATYQYQKQQIESNNISGVNGFSARV